MICYNLFRFFFFLRKNEVQQDCHDEYDGDAVFCKDAPQYIGEYAENLRRTGESETDGKREGDDGHISFGITALTDHTDDDGAEHHEGAAAEDRIGKGSEDDSHGRNQSCQYHDRRSASDGFSVHHFCHGNEADILAERGDRHAAEERRETADEPVYGDGAGDFSVFCISSESHDGKGGGVTQCFRRRYEEDKKYGKYGVGMKFHGIGHESGKGDGRYGSKAAHVHHSEKESRSVTDDETDQNGKLFIKRFCFDIEKKRGN